MSPQIQWERLLTYYFIYFQYFTVFRTKVVRRPLFGIRLFIKTSFYRYLLTFTICQCLPLSALNAACLVLSILYVYWPSFSDSSNWVIYNRSLFGYLLLLVGYIVEYHAVAGSGGWVGYNTCIKYRSSGMYDPRLGPELYPSRELLLTRCS